MISTAVKPRSSVWVASPAIDLIVGCGAWSLPLLLTAYVFEPQLRPWTLLFYTVALVVNYPHYMATIYRTYRTREDFVRYRVTAFYLTSFLIVMLIAAHWSYRLVPWLFTVYLTWSPWHYMGQNFGLSMMFIRRNGLTVNRGDRHALWAAFVASYLLIFLSIHAKPSSDPYFISLGLPAPLHAFRIPLFLVFTVLGMFSLAKLARQAGWRPLLAPATLFVTEFLWFVLPTVIEVTMGVQTSQTYSVSILAIMHCTQYLWITAYYTRQEARTATSATWRWQPYFATLVIGGAALFIPGPWLASYLLGRDFSISVLIFIAIVNIHHFILDGAVWKLRDKRVRSLLTSSDQMSEVAPVKFWWTARGREWRFAGTAGVALLALIIGVDQARYYLANGERTISSLALAAAINPNDSLTQMRLARSYDALGDKSGMESSFRKSVQVNPHDLEAQNGLARILLESGRYAEAIAHYERMFARTEPNAEALMNFGALCKQLHRHDDAIRSFERVLEMRPNYAPAHLLLAEIFTADEKTAEAAIHYQRYAELNSRGR